MQIRITGRSHHHLSEWPTSASQGGTVAGKHVEKGAQMCIAGKSVSQCSHCGQQSENDFRSYKYICPIIQQPTPHLGIYAKHTHVPQREVPLCLQQRCSQEKKYEFNQSVHHKWNEENMAYIYIGIVFSCKKKKKRIKCYHLPQNGGNRRMSC